MFLGYERWQGSHVSILVQVVLNVTLTGLKDSLLSETKPFMIASQIFCYFLLGNVQALVFDELYCIAFFAPNFRYFLRSFDILVFFVVLMIFSQFMIGRWIRQLKVACKVLSSAQLWIMLRRNRVEAITDPQETLALIE